MRFSFVHPYAATNQPREQEQTNHAGEQRAVIVFKQKEAKTEHDDECAVDDQPQWYRRIH